MNLERVKNLFKGKGRPERRRHAILSKEGGELVSNVPIQPPLGYNPQPSMFDVMRDMIARERAQLEREGFETPEEADDFDVDDDLDPSSPHEHNFDPPVEPGRIPPTLQAPPKAAPPQPVPPADRPAPRKSKATETITIPRDEYEALRNAPEEP